MRRTISAFAFSTLLATASLAAIGSQDANAKGEPLVSPADHGARSPAASTRVVELSHPVDLKLALNIVASQP